MVSVFLTSKFWTVAVVIYFATKSASSLQCYHCEAGEVSQETCANNYTLQTCGNHPYGQSYNACYSLNKTYNMPIFGLRFAEKKGCAIADHCDFLRTIECFNQSGLVVNCEFTCCVENECNLGALKPLTPTTSFIFTVTSDLTKARTSTLMTTQEAHTKVLSIGRKSFEWCSYCRLVSVAYILSIMLLKFVQI